MCLQVCLTDIPIKATFKAIKILAPTKLFNWYPVTLSNRYLSKQECWSRANLTVQIFATKAILCICTYLSSSHPS